MKSRVLLPSAPDCPVIFQSRIQEIPSKELKPKICPHANLDLPLLHRSACVPNVYIIKKRGANKRTGIGWGQGGVGDSPKLAWRVWRVELNGKIEVGKKGCWGNSDERRRISGGICPNYIGIGKPFQRRNSSFLFFLFRFCPPLLTWAESSFERVDWNEDGTRWGNREFWAKIPIL